MFDHLKRGVGDGDHGLSHAWNQLAEGWHELIARTRHALTRFSRGHDAVQDAASEWLRFCPGWGLVAGEIEQDDKSVYVRVELPGVDKRDIEIDVLDDVLVVRGEKRFAREASHGSFTLLERSYGRFERSFVLPCVVDAGHARASCRDGVLSISLPKSGGGSRIKVL